jgi:hypothetical protein
VLSFSAASAHVLRSSYLPLYIRDVLPPFSSDPFPSSDPSSSSYGLSTTNDTPIVSTQRETLILDRFILLKVRDDVLADESDLYLDYNDEQYRDLFNFMQVSNITPECRRTSKEALLLTGPLSQSLYIITQPRARTEDLINKYGTRAGLISAKRASFSELSVSWGNRKVGLIGQDSLGRRRLLVEVPRDRNDRLEDIAMRLIKEWTRLVRAGG